MSTQHYPTEIRPAGKRFRVACACGWVSTARVSVRAARTAFECEHGWTAATGYDTTSPIPYTLTIPAPRAS